MGVQRVKSKLKPELDKKEAVLRTAFFFAYFMKQTIWDQYYEVNTFLVNPQKRLGLFGLLNLFQDTAWIHATNLGHGYEEMIRDHTAWVLTRQKLVMSRWPVWGSTIKLTTWVRPVSGIIAIRDFEVWEENELLGKCTTQWLILDLRTRKPAEKNLTLEDSSARKDLPATLEASKIILKDQLPKLAEFHVRNSDLDLNGHVNNTKYAQWVLDSVTEDKHREFTLKEYEVNFIAETKLGDTISILCAQIAEDKFQFQGVRNFDQKVVFAATLTVSA